MHDVGIPDSMRYQEKDDGAEKDVAAVGKEEEKSTSETRKEQKDDPRQRKIPFQRKISTKRSIPLMKQVWTWMTV